MSLVLYNGTIYKRKKRAPKDVNYYLSKILSWRKKRKKSS
jgi:hypothetical protein